MSSSVRPMAQFHYAIHFADQVADLDADLRVRVAYVSQASRKLVETQLRTGLISKLNPLFNHEGRRRCYSKRM